MAHIATFLATLSDGHNTNIDIITTSGKAGADPVGGGGGGGGWMGWLATHLSLAHLYTIL